MKNNCLLLFGAFLLVFAGCQRESVSQNPNYNEDDNTVAVQFVLNVATSSEGTTTKQSASTVQLANNFRGMQDAKLIGLSTGKSNWLAPFAGTSTGYTVNKQFDLGILYGSTAVSNEGSNNANNSSHRVLELAMPLNTDAMLVYARAIPSGNPAADGKLTMTVADTPENTTFSLNSRLGEGDASRKAEYDQTCNLAIAILNRIIGSEVGEMAAGQYSNEGYTNVGVLRALTWKGLANEVAGGDESPLEEILGNAYNTLTTINSGEYRAGSSSAISSIAYYLYGTAKAVFNATPTGDDELNAQRLAYEIMRRIQNYFEKYDDSETAIAFLNISDIKSHMMTATGMTSEAFESAYGSVQHGDLKAFPTSFGLPLGVSLLEYNAGTGFAKKTPSPSLLQQGDLSEEYYMYPAELMYFDNSALRVNNTAVAAAYYPNGYSTWDADGSWTGWSTGAVTSSTRSVAVKNNINYGVAMLQTKVALAEGVTAFKDNRNAITGEGDQALTADQVKKFQLVGVLVGNQNKTVGWNYLAKTSSADEWKYVIYDNNIAGTGAIPTPAGEENYTLVFDNYTPAANQIEKVYVALEFKNNGDDFYGRGNMIRTGGTFYLVGELNNSDGTGTITWPDKYAIPPYTAGGASQQTDRVFIQDVMTQATFKIGENSLKNAFVTVPDLRSSQTSLGLSVDLKWITGKTFYPVLGGSE